MCASVTAQLKVTKGKIAKYTTRYEGATAATAPKRETKPKETKPRETKPKAQKPKAEKASAETKPKEAKETKLKEKREPAVSEERKKESKGGEGAPAPKRLKKMGEMEETGGRS